MFAQAVTGMHGHSPTIKYINKGHVKIIKNNVMIAIPAKLADKQYKNVMLPMLITPNLLPTSHIIQWDLLTLSHWYSPKYASTQQSTHSHHLVASYLDQPPPTLHPYSQPCCPLPSPAITTLISPRPARNSLTKQLLTLVIKPMISYSQYSKRTQLYHCPQKARSIKHKCNRRTIY